MSEATLADYLTKKASELAPADLTKIVAGFRQLRAQWNVNQATGSRKRVSPKKIETAPKKGSATRVLKDLEL